MTGSEYVAIIWQVFAIVAALAVVAQISRSR